MNSSIYLSLFSLAVGLLLCPGVGGCQAVGIRGQCSGEYLGQKAPGEVPEIFAPGVVSTDAWEAAGTFSPDCSEFFFTRRPTHEGTANRLMYMKLEGGQWTNPELASFAVDAVEYEPHITPDGSRVIFNSRRPHPETGRGDRRVWYSDRTMAGWSEARLVNEEINALSPMFVSSTAEGTLYFGAMEGSRYGIFRAKRRGDRYESPEYLPPEVNGVRGASHPFIVPDETFLIFDAYTGSLGESALFLSVRRKDGTWGSAIRLGPEINATNTEIAPSISPDGKCFFFHRQGDIYWVSASILEKYLELP